MIEFDILLRRHGGKRLPVSVVDDSHHLQGCWRTMLLYVGTRRYEQLLQGLRMVELSINNVGQKVLPEGGTDVMAGEAVAAFRAYCRRVKLDCTVTTQIMLGPVNYILFHIRPNGKTGRITFVVTQEQP